MVRCQARSFERADSYWCRICRKPEGYIMKDCVTHQLNMMSQGKKPWLYFVKEVLNLSGFGSYFDRDPSSFHPRALLIDFKERIECISRADLQSEARSPRSLSHYVNIFDPSTRPQSYTSTKYSKRRLIAMVRFNLKYSLPFDHTDRCKLCSESCASSDR